MLCVAGDHPLANQSELTSEALSEYTYMAHRGLQDTVETSDAIRNLVPAVPRMLVNSVQALVRLTLDGVGYAILPEPEIREYIASGKLVNVMPEWKKASYSVYAIGPKHDATPVKTLAAVQILQEAFAEI